MINAQEISIKLDEVENQLRVLTESVKKRLVTEKDVIQKLNQIRDKLSIAQERVSRNI